MQTQTKQKPAGPAATMAKQYRVTPREMNAMGKFSNSCDKFLKTTSIGRGAFGVGCCMKMSGKAADYEVILDGHGSVLLGKVEGEKRIKLCETGTNTEAGWNLLLETVEREEKL